VKALEGKLEALGGQLEELVSLFKPAKNEVPEVLPRDVRSKSYVV
jgi:hypothetical protein